MSVPNVFDLEGDELAVFVAECDRIASNLTAGGLECSPTQVARGVRIGALISVATATRSTKPGKWVLALADNPGACALLAQAIEALDVDPTPDQLGAFVSMLTTAMTGSEAAAKKKIRPYSG